VKNEDLQENIQVLLKQKSIEQKELSKLKAQTNAERLKESISDLFTRSKTKKLEQENAQLKNTVQHLEMQLVKEKTEKHQLISTYEGQITEKQYIIDKISDYFPEIKEKLWIARLCETMKLGTDLIRQLLKGKRVTGSGNLYSTEFSQNFKTNKSILHIDENPNAKEKLRLRVDNMDVYGWFRVKKQEFMKSIGINVRQPQDRNRGNKL
jgi:hypothetical protein